MRHTALHAVLYIPESVFAGEANAYGRYVAVRCFVWNYNVIVLSVTPVNPRSHPFTAYDDCLAGTSGNFYVGFSSDGTNCRSGYFIAMAVKGHSLRSIRLR